MIIPFERVALQPVIKPLAAYPENALQRISWYLKALMHRINSLFQGVEHTPKYSRGGHLKKELLQNDPYIIISIDGGGVRGVVPLTVLMMLEQTLGVKIASIADCMAGSSTGGIVALGLTVPDQNAPNQTRYWAKDILDLYNSFAAKVFSTSMYERVSSLWGLYSPKYPSPKAVYESLIGDVKIQDCLVKKIVVTSVDAKSGEIVLFENTQKDSRAVLDAQDITAHSAPSTTSCTSVALASSAAPTYFESVVENGRNLVDGGVAVNNPAQIATFLAQEEETGRPIFVFSIGTGRVLDTSDYSKPITSGSIGWAKRLIYLQIDASSENANFQLERQAKKNPNVSYLRFQVDLEDEDEAELDNATPQNLQHLVALATKTFQHFSSTDDFQAFLKVLQNKIRVLEA